VTGVQTCALPICPPSAVVSGVDANWEKATGEFARFEIKYR
jgi:hypothetical protein